MRPIAAIVETSVYVANERELDLAREFYARVLGLTLSREEKGRHAFFSVGEGMLLVFNSQATRKADHPPPHGASGVGHFALGIAREDYDAWRDRLLAHDVAIGREIQWPTGGKSIYFLDPAGNLAELVTPGVWGLPSGW